MISWKTVKMTFDNATHAIILSGRTRHSRTTKYITTREELTTWQWFLENVWNARFRWDPNMLNARGERGAIVRIDLTRPAETLAEKRP